jgi:hypothetical protein
MPTFVCQTSVWSDRLACFVLLKDKNFSPVSVKMVLNSHVMVRNTCHMSHDLLHQHMPTELLPGVLKLVPHPVARDKVISTARLRAGLSVLSTFGFATILLDSEKGRRCDACFRLSNESRSLRRCSGCGSYWYCNAQCMLDSELHPFCN